MIRTRGVKYVVLDNHLSLCQFVLTCIAQNAVCGYYNVSVAGLFYRCHAVIFPQITLLVVCKDYRYAALLCILK